MLKVEVQAVGVGKIKCKIPAEADVDLLLKHLHKNYANSLSNLINSKTGKTHSYVSIWVNSTSIKKLQKFKTKLKDGDTVTIFRPSAGG